MTPNPVSPASYCPLCGQANQCASEIERTTGQTQPACWCTQVAFSADVLANIPDAQRGVACVCAACAAGTPPTSPRSLGNAQEPDPTQAR